MRDEKLSSRRSCSYYQKSAPRKFANFLIKSAICMTVLFVAGYITAARAADSFPDTSAIEKMGSGWFSVGARVVIVSVGVAGAPFFWRFSARIWVTLVAGRLVKLRNISP